MAPRGGRDVREAYSSGSEISPVLPDVLPRRLIPATRTTETAVTMAIAAAVGKTGRGPELGEVGERLCGPFTSV